MDLLSANFYALALNTNHSFVQSFKNTKTHTQSAAESDKHERTNLFILFDAFPFPLSLREFILFPHSAPTRRRRFLIRSLGDVDLHTVSLIILCNVEQQNVVN